MKEIMGFIQWQWQRWEMWQKIFIVGMVVFVLAAAFPTPYDVYVVLSLSGAVLVWTFKWAVWDNVQASWIKYKQERNSLLTTIKNSDK
jgi:hypothetical protein